MEYQGFNQIKVQFISGSIADYNDANYESTACYSDSKTSSDNLTIASLKKHKTNKSKKPKQLDGKKSPIKTKKKYKRYQFIE